MEVPSIQSTVEETPDGRAIWLADPVGTDVAQILFKYPHIGSSKYESLKNFSAVHKWRNRYEKVFCLLAMALFVECGGLQQ